MLRYWANVLLINGAALLFDGATLLFDTVEALLIPWKNCATCDRLLLLLRGSCATCDSLLLFSPL